MHTEVVFKVKIVINKVFVLSLHTAAPAAKSRNSNDIIS